MRTLRSSWLSGFALAVLTTGALIGCQPAADHSAHGGDDDDAAAPAATTADAPSTAPRVFFVEPADGATVGTLVNLRFGHENFTIEPAGDGAIHAGAGHHHVGLDTQCLPAGEVIPKADPWVHFGDGTAEIEFALSPGPHTLTIQIGDGEHRTSAEPGLCATIHVTAAEQQG